MKTTNSFNLVEGSFNSEDASEIITSLIDSKVKFHKHKIFSNEIRFGTKDEHSEGRIKELQGSHQRILDFIRNGNDNQKKITIHSSIVVEIES